MTPGETEIPVSPAAMAIVSRSNENAAGMAKVETGGFEMIIRNAIILPPDQ